MEFDETFESQFYTHSDDPSCRVMMINCRKMEGFSKKLRQARARLVFDIEAKSPLPGIEFHKSFFVIFDGNGEERREEPSFIYPNTTTLVDIVLNRRQSEKLLHLSDHARKRLARRPEARKRMTGRGSLVKGR